MIEAECSFTSSQVVKQSASVFSLDLYTHAKGQHPF